LFHVLMWASVTQRFEVLKTPRGLERMASRGMMTPRQLEVLQSLDVPNDLLQNAPLEWMMIRSIRAMENGTLAGDTATKGQLLKQMGDLRDTKAAIGNKLAGRMPLAYTHFVQILVDTFVLIAPLALYANLGEYSVIAVGILTLFYTGLLNLAKIFLDPLNNENFCENSIFMDLGVLIRESNTGSTRWKNAGARLPFD
jgi:predicted membrane chloride channel (bestrophin family)